MPLVDRFYDWLSQGPAPGCDHVFAAGLSHAEPGWSERIIRALLGRGHDASWAALIGRFEQLAPHVRAQLRERGDWMRDGIALALRSSSPEARANALRALDEHPVPRMAYLLPDALRDPEPRVRTLAARVWRKMVDAFLDRPPPAADADAVARRARATERRQIILALGEALRTFDLHNRVEVLETSLWFARELGEALWKKLTARGSRAGTLVNEHLASWSHPRLAHFVVCALRQPIWRETAGRVLRTWKTVPELSALLRESDLLDDPKIRAQLNAVRQPQWFAKCDDGLTGLPPHLRPSAPRWVCHAGYRERDRAALLARWLRASDARLHEAVVYALAEVDTVGARVLLTQVADSASPLAPFARWCVAGLDTDLVRSTVNRAGKRHRRARRGPDPGRPSVDRRPPHQRPAPFCSLPVEHTGRSVTATGADEAQARREFKAALDRLSTNAVDPADADLIDRARDLLEDVYNEQFAPAHVGSSPGRAS